MVITDIIKTTFTNAASASAVKDSSDNSDTFESYMTTTYTLDDIFNIAADKYGISRDLLKAVAKTESEFREDVVSYCGAKGFMQLMPQTAQSLGVSDSFDPVQNIMGGAKLLSELMDKYDGDTSLALAAYNGGVGNVAKHGGVPSFCEKYVEKVTSYINSGVTVPDKSISINLHDGSSYVSGKNADTSYSGVPISHSVAMSSNVPTSSDVSASTTYSTADSPVSTSDKSSINPKVNYHMLEAFKNYTEYIRIMDMINRNSDDNNDKNDRSF